MKKHSNVLLAYETIRSMIISSELVPGQQLVEQRMAEICNMSRTPVREAIRLLENDGFIEIIPNRGSFVRTLSKEEAMMAHEVASAMDGMAAFLCAEQMSEGLLTPQSEPYQELIRLADSMEANMAEYDYRQWIVLDEKFHELLLRLSGNRSIQDIRMRILTQLNQIWWFGFPLEEDKSASNREHREILAFIASGSKMQAQQCSFEHRMHARNRIKEMLHSK